MARARYGFTLVEILIVVAIIGILAAIAVPKFARVSERAYLATMQVDLHHLATIQANYAESHSGLFIPTTLTSNLDIPVPVLGTDGRTIFLPSSGVIINIVSLPAAPNGAPAWSAVASHVSLNKVCAIFYGLSAPLAPATHEGEPKCQS